MIESIICDIKTGFIWRGLTEESSVDLHLDRTQKEGSRAAGSTAHFNLGNFSFHSSSPGIVEYFVTEPPTQVDPNHARHTVKRGQLPIGEWFQHGICSPLCSYLRSSYTPSFTPLMASVPSSSTDILLNCTEKTKAPSRTQSALFLPTRGVCDDISRILLDNDSAKIDMPMRRV